MIKQFRNLDFINLFLLFIILFFLRIGVYFDLPQEVNSGFDSFFSRLLIPIDLDKLLNPLLSITLATIVVFLQALIFNKIINKFNILGKASFIPALLFVVCSSVFTPFLILSPPLICNFFLLYIFNKILEEYKSTDSIAAMFDMGLVIAIGTIFYFPFIVFVLLIWIALILFKPFNWREWASVFTGYITIVFLLGVYYYWNDRLLSFYEIWKPLSIKPVFYLKIEVLDYIVLFPIAMCALLSFIMLRLTFFKSYVLVRKSYQLLLFVFVFSVLSIYLRSDFRINHFLLSAIPMSVLLAHYFINAKKRWLYESFFLVILSFIIYFQFF